MGEDTPAALGALRVDEGKLRNHVDEVVRSSVEETLNGLLDEEADQICRAQRYERSLEREDPGMKLISIIGVGLAGALAPSEATRSARLRRPPSSSCGRLRRWR